LGVAHRRRRRLHRIRHPFILCVVDLSTKGAILPIWMTRQRIGRHSNLMMDLRIGIILGSTRPGRRGAQVAKWVLEKAQAHGGAQFELIDLADYPLPHLDEAIPPSAQQYANEHTKAWSRTIDGFDGFILVTPEYNRSTSGVLKNAIDYLYHEWNNKAVGF